MTAGKKVPQRLWVFSLVCSMLILVSQGAQAAYPPQADPGDIVTETDIDSIQLETDSQENDCGALQYVWSTIPGKPIGDYVDAGEPITAAKMDGIRSAIRAIYDHVATAQGKTWDCATQFPGSGNGSSVCESVQRGDPILSKHIKDIVFAINQDGAKGGPAWPAPGETCDIDDVIIFDGGGACGNGVLNGVEECDDSNGVDGDGCSSACQCERAWVDAGASCGTDGCQPAEKYQTAPATSPQCGAVSRCAPCVGSCGDSIKDAGEECDDGTGASSPECLDNCTCNAEWRDWGCGLFGDPPNQMYQKRCLKNDPTCTLPGSVPDCEVGAVRCPVDPRCPGTGVCGNGVKDIGEACDDGNTNSGDGCSTSCSCENNLVSTPPDWAGCGDGGCLPTQKPQTLISLYPGCPDIVTCLDASSCGGGAVCGNGEKEGAEECDPPNGTTCDNNCKALVSGCECEPWTRLGCGAYGFCPKNKMKVHAPCNPHGCTLGSEYFCLDDPACSNCGNGVPDPGETPDNCCSDTGCPADRPHCGARNACW